MSTFTYEKIGQYSQEVVNAVLGTPKHNKSPKGKLWAVNGELYSIKTSRNSTFWKFQQLVTKLDFAGAEELVKKEQFEITDPPQKVRISPTDRPKDKWLKLGWTEIEKSKFSSKNIEIKTPQQEKITLLIIKQVLGDDTKTWKSFAEMFHAPKSPIKKIFPDLPKLKEWWANFELQFKQISKIGKFPNSSYGVYLYDEPGNFMDYISKLVREDMNLYSQKDSWNPADIWLIKSRTIQNDYIKKFDEIKGELNEGVVYADDPYQSIRDINLLLKNAYSKKDIVGISLKKTDGKTLHYTEFNLQMDPKKQALPKIKFNGMQINCSYDEKSYTFTSKTAYVYVSDGDRGAFKMAFRSNSGTTIGNITYEFLPDGPASAQLGKVPKDKFQEWLTDNIQKRQKKAGKLTGETLDVKIPQSSLLDKKWDKRTSEKKWKDKIKFIKDARINDGASKGRIDELDNFVKNLEHSYSGVGLHIKNSNIQQMVEFVWILAKLKKQKNLIKFMTKCYYFAQKKGQIYNFGPFAKVY